MSIFTTSAVALLAMATPATGPAQCIDLGGTGLAQAVSDTAFVGALAGELGGGARARVEGQRETATGLELDMRHFFFTDEGGLLETKDIATLTAVPTKDGNYMLEIHYKVQNASGTFAGYTGEFKSRGLLNFNDGSVVLKYSGQICK